MSTPATRILTTAQWRDVIDAATHAPSSHNSQPWLLRVDEGAGVIDVCADRTRRIPVNDPDDRELTLSCGAVVFGLEVALADLGCGCVVSVLPDPDEPDLLARVVATDRSPKVWSLATLRPFLTMRSTYRKPFGPEAVPGDVRDAMVDAAAAHGCTLIVIDDTELRADVVSLVVEGDRAQFADPAWREELATWLSRPGSTAGLPTPAAAVARTIVTHVDLGGRRSARDVEYAEQAPLLTVLASADDTAPARVEAGRALHHVLLVAASRGISASYLNQPCQVSALRTELAERLGVAAPQMVLRAGFPMTAPRPSGRRPVDDVLHVARP
jgi:hypothetical protein